MAMSKDQLHLNSDIEPTDIATLPVELIITSDDASEASRTSRTKWPTETSGVVDPPDLTLVVGDEDIACHRRLLAESSGYFRAMFASGMRESGATCVQLKAVSAADVCTLVRSLYSGTLELTSSTVCSVLQTAVMLQFDDAVAVCVAFARRHMTVNNCLTVAAVASESALDDLALDVELFAAWFFTDFVRTNAFYESSDAFVEGYLGSDGLNVGGEREVFDALLAWYGHNEGDVATEESACRLFRCVRLNLLSDAQLHAVAATALVARHPSCLLAVQTTLSHRHVNRPLPLKATRRQVRQALWVAAVKPDCGTMQLWKRATQDQSREVVTELPAGPPNLVGFQICVLGRHVYVLGGTEGLACRRSPVDVYRFDTFARRWDVVCALTQRRRHHAAVAFDGRIYVLGGFDSNWETLPPLPKTFVNGAACVYEDSGQKKIFAIKERIHYLVPGVSHCWTEILVQQAMRVCSAVPVGDVIYLLDERSSSLLELRPEAPVECRTACSVDIQERTDTLCLVYTCFSLAVTNGRLVGLEGRQQIEYDPSTGQMNSLLANEDEKCLFSVPVRPCCFPDDDR